MGEGTGFRFFAIPGRLLEGAPAPLTADSLVEPEFSAPQDAIDKALYGAEFRDKRAKDRLTHLLEMAAESPLPRPSGCQGPAAIFARPPHDLPALLRLADQLDHLANTEAGERALVWKCQGCATRYAVPLALAQPVTIRCEKCDRPISLFAEYSMGEEALLDPSRGLVNLARRGLAGFFREAMARGWAVLVCSL